MLRTESGRLSRTQKLQIVSSILQGVNVSAFVAFGFPAEWVAAGAMVITMLQSSLTMYIRLTTVEQMKR